MAPLRRLKVAAFLLLAVVIVISVVHMVIGLGSAEIIAFVFSPWFVVPGFIVAWLLAPWLFDRQANG
jgi:hypothetical protein